MLGGRYEWRWELKFPFNKIFSFRNNLKLLTFTRIHFLKVAFPNDLNLDGNRLEISCVVSRRLIVKMGDENTHKSLRFI